MKLLLYLAAVLLCGGIPASAQEQLDEPPLVTAKAWAIADGSSGKLLWGWNPDVPQKAASTTKMMCAYVVLKLAEKNPAVLEEVVKFSTLADRTTGSTSEILAGEAVSVADGLYALLLPSGNDMGNALAEHFNRRFPPPAPEEIASPAYATRKNFIAEMNRAAATLGLVNTRYRLPYGDGGTAADRTTTARELLVVAHAAMQNALFRKIVATPQYVASVRTPDGQTREITWKNTNKLLAMSAYDGIKTGGTPSAGSCLVASGRRGSHHLLVTVIGSTSDAGRYVDTRNLLRWAWRELEK